MATKIITAVVALFLGITFSTFAGDKNKENKDTKEVTTEVETPALTEANTQTTLTYYVVGEFTDDFDQEYYIVSTNPPSGNCPNTGLKPCEIRSNQEKDGADMIPIDAVESVESVRPNY